uniref:Lysosomal membrane ascorbate-dependent ferrireductase CYB561A3 n=1 Tax=Gadus morhua TaxID=8049 RepID=A0A8C5C7Y0_GADMO
MNKGNISTACVCVFFSVALPLCAALPTPPPGTNQKAELLRQGSCPEGLYPSASLCCLNCPAGEHQVSPCSSDRGSSVCSKCPMGTFTDHSNDLHTCLTCTRCPPDQEEVQPCSPTNNTMCRCKPGSFCAHDQACEACQRCRSCNDGETRVKSCTAHSNSECAKTSTPGTPTEGRSPDSGSAPLGLPSLSPGHSQQEAKRHGPLEIAQNAHNVLVEIPLLPPEKSRSDGSVDEEDPGLGSSSSETSLTVERTSTPSPQTPAGWTTSPPNARVAMRSSVPLYLCLLLCACLGVACVAGVCVWNSQWHGGFAWDDSGLKFNWHPVLMVSGLVVVYGFGAVLYRVPLTWGGDKLPWKLAHAGAMLLALVLAVVGLCAVFQNHATNHIPPLYSLHSWVGICSVFLFATQWAVGVGAFLLPCSPVALRVLLKPLHVWLGASILTLSIAACVSGINEKLIFALKGTVNGTLPYSALPPEAVFANSLGALIVVFGLVVLRILSNRSWERPEPGGQDTAYRPLLQEENE